MRRYRPEPDPFPSLPAPRRKLRVVAAARTDRGRERPDNQDRAVLGHAADDEAWEPPAAVEVDVLPSAFYALVCDGMGGEAGGALASGLAIETIVPAMRACWGGLGDDVRLARGLVASLEAAAARIKQAARADPMYARMGTTATLAAIGDGALICAQVGDSRAYVLRRGALVQVTRDQTMVELLRSSGALAPDQIEAVVGPNVILQALGSSTRLDVAITRTPLAEGDVILLCSDGLHGPVSDEEIAQILGSSVDPAAACDALVARANDSGGPDNISCVVVRVSGGDLAASPSADDGAEHRDGVVERDTIVR